MEPQIEQIIALNMVGDPDYLRMKYPVAIAFVVALSPLKIAWFALPDTQLARAEHRGGPRDFKYTNVNLTWDKEWIKHNWWKSKKKRPTVSQIMEAWKMDDRQARRTNFAACWNPWNCDAIDKCHDGDNPFF